MRQLIWEQPKRQREKASRHADVSCKLNKSGRTTDGKQRYSIAFRFSDDAERRIMQGRDRITFAVTEDRVYFKSCETDGFSLNRTINGKKVRPYFRADAQEPMYWLIHQGEYDLNYDPEERLCYIDLRRKIR
jgi:hypothetical protein